MDSNKIKKGLGKDIKDDVGGEVIVQMNQHGSFQFGFDAKF